MRDFLILTFLIGILTSLSREDVVSQDHEEGMATFAVLVPKWLGTSAHLSMWLAPGSEPANATLRLLQQTTSQSFTLHDQLTLVSLNEHTEDQLGGYVVDFPKSAVIDAAASLQCQQDKATYQHLPVAPSGQSFVITAMRPLGFQRTVLHVIGLYNDTTIRITEPQYSSLKTSLESLEQEQKVMQVSLGADKLLSYDSAHDLSGFTLTSNHPISLFVETEWNKPHSNVDQHFVSPQLPVNLWGCSYIDMIPTESNYFSMYKVTAATLPTNVQFWTRVRSGTLHMMYSPQTEVHVSSVDEYILLKADRPILVAHVLQSLDAISCRSAEIHFIPPVNHWTATYRFFLNESNHVWIVSDKLNTDYIIDDLSLAEYSNNSVEFSSFNIGAANFATTHLYIKEGIHTLSSLSGIPFIISGHRLSFGHAFHEDSKPCIQRPNPRPAYHNINQPVKGSHNPVVFRVETLGDKASSRNDHIDLHQVDSVDDSKSDSSSSSIIAVAVSTSMAVLLVIMCIGGFVLMDLWNKRQVIGRVKVSPYIPY